MGMDRNTLIGFGLLGLLLIGMFVINSRSRLSYEAEQKRIADSIELTKPKPDPKMALVDSLKADSMRVAASSQTSLQAQIPQQEYIVENDVVKITFSNKGAQPVAVELKKFKRPNGQPLLLQKGNFNKFTYAFNSGENQTAQSENIIFSSEPVKKNEDGSQSLLFFLGDSSGKQIAHRYTLRPGSYMLDFDIEVYNSGLFGQNEINILWQAEAPQLEGDFNFEKMQTNVCYLEDGSYDFERIGASDDDIKFKRPVDWVVLRQQFFGTGLIAKSKLKNVQTDIKAPADSNQAFIARTITRAKVDIGASGKTALQYYFGPSDYKILKSYNIGLEDIVPYGSGVFAFVKYINRYILLPVFDFFNGFMSSMGLVILLLTFFIRLFTAPMLYKSYLSGAKMRALKPEVDALKKKFTDPKTKTLDQQAFGMEQMKLWRSAGVSPLGGCIPGLLQVPIFMSLYYFFQANIDLRGKSFLWAKDLAVFDSIYQIPFSIPFYGNHVSLFTLTAVITSLIISVYSMSQMQDNSNPMMKYLPYFFPILLLGVFNNLPAALTWYYTVSNVITLIMQVIIQKYIINHEKILAQINENMKKPAKKSKLAERIEAMQAQQQKIQEMKKKTGNK
ncbi:MAG: membrane protein insertase YidC [Ferruginibacter sp.]|nr:membrane protein insertase YidC [Ferruginibacter sp.]